MMHSKSQSVNNLKLPIIVVNFKTYEQATGINAEKLAKTCEKVAHETGKSIAIAVQEVDLYRISNLVDIPVLSEHMDAIEPGAHTGHNLPLSLKENGADGTLVNHSEDRLRIDVLEETITIAKETGLITIACANDAKTAESIAAFSPDLIAVEPPELIGGDISVSQAKPEVITNTIKLVKHVADIPVLVGAGVKTGDDVRKAIHLGAQGILVASGIVKAKDPYKILKEFADAI